MFMKVIKRNQIIIFVGALMLIVAGYLNFSDNGLPIDNLVPTSTLADAEEMASIGDAKLVSANVVDGEQENEIQDIVNNNDLNDSVIETNTEADIKNNDKNVSENITESSTTETSSNNIESVNKDKQLNNNYFTQSRLDRDTMYSQTLDTYQKIIENESISADQKAIAQKEISKINEQKNSIMIAENLIKVKVFEDLIIFINGENVSVIVKSDKLEEKEMQRLQNLEQILHQRVVGQEEAVHAVSKAIRRGRVGLKDPKRPIGSFLFLGPTGVGKTELSKALAVALFGDERSLIRFDMSEYMEKHTVSRLIGSPPGYVGYDEGGQLSERVRQHPYSVILFDEIEKAHPDIFNVFLQILDDGQVTDAQGRTIDFKNTVIIMTSNIGARSIVAPSRLGFSLETTEKARYEDMRKQVMEEVKRLFRPEFLNRVDEILVFHVLNRTHIDQIVEILFAQMAERMEKAVGVPICMTEKAKNWIVDQGFDAAYGARPLRRLLQNQIEDQAADMLLAGQLGGASKIVVDQQENAIILKTE